MRTGGAPGIARMAMAMALLAACAGDGGSATDSGSTPTDTVDTDTVPVGCVRLIDGLWEASGAAFGAEVFATLVLDGTGCAFTLTEWDTVDSTPTGGVVVGDQVTLDGDAYWQSCTGRVSTDGALIDGTCASDGAAFSLSSEDNPGM